MSRWLVEDCKGQILQLFLNLNNLSDQLGTVVAVYWGGNLLWLGGGLVANQVFSCEESVDFSFQESHSFCQNMGFSG